ncbi:SRPBCC domain-containing protein [Flavobacterium sp. LMO8]|uniref:SRPBCC domain-containing protein n=1 Tax=Flavobacterium sp. LMO8 TaxID=2654244 RepID=UPI001291A2BF|nr:SRPBCC domain-containing protein [Flavobacterium sp. LMO8]MQP24815.1 SRPBCC domain-containing protein [Flavobacterium sp. LMO8]
MKNLSFEIEINAPTDKVWIAMWEEENYKKWTTAFCEGSYAKSSWKQGERIHFLDPNGNGMYSEISVLVPNEKMYFTHIGNIKNFEEQPLDEDTKAWTGAQENYEIIKIGSLSKVLVTLDIVDEHANYFLDCFPKGLETIKEIAEK